MTARNALLSVALALAATPAGVADACSVPVFRYALNRWAPEPFEAIVLCGPGQTDAARRTATNAPSLADANLEISFVDTQGGIPDELRAAWAPTNRPPRLPWIVVRFPTAYRRREDADVWISAPLLSNTVAQLVTSPARQEVSRRILAGHAAVWVLLASGNDPGDRVAETTLRKRLEAITSGIRKEAAAQVAAGAKVDYWEQTADPNALTNIEFSVLRVSRTDPAEQVFVSMLTKTEPDLRDLAGEPVTIPVFGQGRALFALVGKGITDENITEACEFLTGPCSCVVKEQNPGTDLLFSAKWWSAATPEFDRDPEPGPALTGVMPEIQPERQTTNAVAAPASPPQMAGSGPPPGQPARRSPGPSAYAPMGLGGALVVVILTGALLMRRRRDR